MDTQRNTALSSFVYHRMPTKVSRKDLPRYIAPPLKRPNTGPKPPLSLSNILHDLLSVLPPGMQWDQRTTKRHALHDTNVYTWPNRWSQDGS